ncbi:hypothetical protein ACFWUT_04200 [Streptomyces cyaneofuscatus]|uniref:hypothetical protein n=1 Tax=Streptomyces cyaneofuscatus TaxID=66883 RepID=UPI003656987F
MSSGSALNLGGVRESSRTTACNRSPTRVGGTSGDHQDGCLAWSMKPLVPSAWTWEPTGATTVTVTVVSWWFVR